jgi:uracil-DNA glycosylase
MNYHPSWQPLFKEYDFDLDSIYENNPLPVYPPKYQVFRVFEMPLNKIRIVLLGQDCYHGPNQAHGLAFSVEKTEQIPPSLKNIYKELQTEFPDRNYKFTHGDLSRWVIEENIFLLNTALTVELHKPNCHAKLWKEFTDDTIKFISDNNPDVIFLLLGNNAKEKVHLIKNKNNIITGVHPSPLSASRGFFNSNLFKKVEEILNKPVNWQN